jgi:5'-nucleotidase
MGTLQRGELLSDSVLISKSRNIDLVIGGHTHQLFENHKVANLDGDSILSVQMLKSGVYVGKVQLTVE